MILTQYWHKNQKNIKKGIEMTKEYKRFYNKYFNKLLKINNNNVKKTEIELYVLYMALKNNRE